MKFNLDKIIFVISGAGIFVSIWLHDVILTILYFICFFWQGKILEDKKEL